MKARSRKKQEDYMEQIGVSGQIVELVELTDENMVTLKQIFRLNFPSLMSTIVRILLYRNEEKLACLLTAYYEIELESNMIDKAVEMNHT